MKNESHSNSIIPQFPQHICFPISSLKDSTIGLRVSVLLLHIVHNITPPHFDSSNSLRDPFLGVDFSFLTTLTFHHQENVLYLVRPHHLVRDGQQKSLVANIPPSQTVRCGGPFVEMTCSFLCRPSQSTFAHLNGRHPLLSSLKRRCCNNYFCFFLDRGLPL